jgi:hypothetical protein
MSQNFCYRKLLVFAGLAACASSAYGGNADFQTRCTAAGVLKCVTFDFNANAVGQDFHHINQGVSPTSSDDRWVDPTPTQVFHDLFDTSAGNQMDGTGALRLEITSPLQTRNTSGGFHLRFGRDFVAGDTYWLQYAVKIDNAYLSTPFSGTSGSSGIKQHLIYNENIGSCQGYGQFVLEHVYNSTVNNGYFTQYSDCGNLSLQIGRQEQQGDYNCQYSLRASGNFSNCFVMQADKWYVFTYQIALGVAGSPTTTYKGWETHDGVTKQFMNVPNIALQSNDGNDDRVNHINLGPYMSDGTDGFTFAPNAHIWYDDVIISAQPIAFPGGGATPPSGGSPPPVVVAPPTPPNGVQFRSN